MKVSPAAMIIVGDDAFGVPLGGARLEFSQTMPAYKDGRPFCHCIIPVSYTHLTLPTSDLV